MLFQLKSAVTLGPALYQNNSHCSNKLSPQAQAWCFWHSETPAILRKIDSFFFLSCHLIWNKYLSRIITSLQALNTSLIVWHLFPWKSSKQKKRSKKVSSSKYKYLCVINAQLFNYFSFKRFDLAATEAHWWKSPAGISEQIAQP